MNRQQDFLKVVVIITATSATSGNGELIVHALQNIQDNMAYHRKVFRCIILAHARVILAEGHIKAPVQGILNTPVTSGRYRELSDVFQRGNIRRELTSPTFGSIIHIMEGEPSIISYDPLWKKLIDLKFSKTEMAEKCGISKNTLAKLGKNEYVALEMIERICLKLEIPVEDVLEVRCDDPTGN